MACPGHRRPVRTGPRLRAAGDAPLRRVGGSGAGSDWAGWATMAAPPSSGSGCCGFATSCVSAGRSGSGTGSAAAAGTGARLGRGLLAGLRLLVGHQRGAGFGRRHVRGIGRYGCGCFLSRRRRLGLGRRVGLLRRARLGGSIDNARCAPIFGKSAVRHRHRRLCLRDGLGLPIPFRDRRLGEAGIGIADRGLFLGGLHRHTGFQRLCQLLRPLGGNRLHPDGDGDVDFLGVRQRSTRPLVIRRRGHLRDQLLPRGRRLAAGRGPFAVALGKRLLRDLPAGQRRIGHRMIGGQALMADQIAQQAAVKDDRRDQARPVERRPVAARRLFQIQQIRPKPLRRTPRLGLMERRIAFHDLTCGFDAGRRRSASNSSDTT